MKKIFGSRLICFMAGGLVLSGCEFKTKTDNPQTDSSADAAYFNDAMDAVGDDEVPDSVTDDSVKSHIAGPKLDAMADRKMAELDADKSGSISEQEFLDHDGKRKAAEGTLTDDHKAKRQDRLKAEFAKFAGDDSVMTRDELKTFLERQGPRVSGHRRKSHNAEAHRGPHPQGRPEGRPEAERGAGHD